MDEDIKINVFTVIAIILTVLCIPILIISDIINNRTMSFIFETVAITVYPLLFIYYLGVKIKKAKPVILIIKVVLFCLFIYFISPSLIQRYSDFPSALMHNYSYIEGEARVTNVGTKGFVNFKLNGSEFSIRTHNFDDVLRRDNKMDIQLRVWYLPISKYIMDIKWVQYPWRLRFRGSPHRRTSHSH